MHVLRVCIYACRPRGALLRGASTIGGDPQGGARALPADGTRRCRPAAAPPPQLQHPQLCPGPRPRRPRRSRLLHLPARGRHRRPAPRYPAVALVVAWSCLHTMICIVRTHIHKSMFMSAHCERATKTTTTACCCYYGLAVSEWGVCICLYLFFFLPIWGEPQPRLNMRQGHLIYHPKRRTKKESSVRGQYCVYPRLQLHQLGHGRY
jgi:hypothetical protein